MTQGQVGALELDDRRFAVRTEQVDGREYIRVTGEMDLSVIGLVDRVVERAEETEATRIVLDLDELEFVDASGLRLLLHLRERLLANGRRLRITRSASPQVRRVMELSGVGKLLPFED